MKVMAISKVLGGMTGYFEQPEQLAVHEIRKCEATSNDWRDLCIFSDQGRVPVTNSGGNSTRLAEPGV